MITYSGGTPEFRILVKENEDFVMQVRYVKQEVGYIGKWQDVPVVREKSNEQSNKNI